VDYRSAVAAGSLFFSEVMQLPPCVSVLVSAYCDVSARPYIAVGIVTRDRRMKNYALPVCLAGCDCRLSQLLYYQLIPESITPCAEGFPALETN
jgi:disulfide bond formation protein DsbB